MALCAVADYLLPALSAPSASVDSSAGGHASATTPVIPDSSSSLRVTSPARSSAEELGNLQRRKKKKNKHRRRNPKHSTALASDALRTEVDDPMSTLKKIQQDAKKFIVSAANGDLPGFRMLVEKYGFSNVLNLADDDGQVRVYSRAPPYKCLSISKIIHLCV